VELSHEDEMRRLRLFKVESSDEGRGRGDAVLAHLSGLLAVPITREDTTNLISHEEWKRRYGR
jgi:hypothetical protein